MANENILTKIKMILTWYWTEDEDAKDLARAIKLTLAFVENRTSKFTEMDWWTFYDALGSWPERDDELDKMYERAEEGNYKSGLTPCS